MNTQDNLYCKIYINTAHSRGAVLEFLSKIVSGVICHRRTVASRYLDLDVVVNKSFSVPGLNNEDEFLSYPIYLDVEPNSRASAIEYIVAVSELLQGLWAAGFDAVAACDFEDKLPRRGGVS